MRVCIPVGRERCLNICVCILVDPLESNSSINDSSAITSNNIVLLLIQVLQVVLVER